jgi:putative peptide zinc metalloprotease protein
VAVCLALGLSAALLVAVQFDVFRSKLPAFYQFFSPANAFLLAITLALTKVLHEFGHGLSCKHFGGECHEMGVMILVLTPCLYCNVSDSWMLPSKWQRAAIGAAGMYVELVLASVATYVWWFSAPGLLNNLALNVVFVCSVSTVIFNANPLLRYDGYYILADILEIPNLRQKASTILGQKLGSWCLGLEAQEDPFLPQRHQLLFALYSVAAVIYRWIVAFSILWFLYSICKQYRLEPIGWAMAAASLGGLIGQPLWQLGKHFSVPGRFHKVKKPRLYATLAVLGGALAFVLFVPLPYSVLATVEVQARDAESVYVDVPGMLKRVAIRPGDRLEKDDLLAELERPELKLVMSKLESSVRETETRLATLDRFRSGEPQAGAEAPALRASLAARKKELADRREEEKRLRILAPAAGTVLPPPWTPKQEDPEGTLPGWTGTPLEPRNLGAMLDDKVLLCQIGDPRRLEAILVIDQADIRFVRARQFERDAEGRLVRDENGEPVVVRPGQRVDLQLDVLPFDPISGEVLEVSHANLKVASRRLSSKSGSDLATKTDPSGAERPLSPSYQARVVLDDPEGVLRLGLRGRAKIYMDSDEWQTLGQRFWRLVVRTFNFKM